MMRLKVKPRIVYRYDYPHRKKISATLSAVHLECIDEIIDDIWYIHNEIGLDMNQMNLSRVIVPTPLTVARNFFITK